MIIWRTWRENRIPSRDNWIIWTVSWRKSVTICQIWNSRSQTRSRRSRIPRPVWKRRKLRKHGSMSVWWSGYGICTSGMRPVTSTLCWMPRASINCWTLRTFLNGSQPMTRRNCRNSKRTASWSKRKRRDCRQRKRSWIVWRWQRKPRKARCPVWSARHLTALQNMPGIFRKQSREPWHMNRRSNKKKKIWKHSGKSWQKRSPCPRRRQTQPGGTFRISPLKRETVICWQIWSIVKRAENPMTVSWR